MGDMGHDPSDQQVLDLADQVHHEDSDSMGHDDMDHEDSAMGHGDMDHDDMLADGPGFDVDNVSEFKMGDKTFKAAMGKAARSALRAKIATEMGFSKMLDEAHPEGGFATHLDVKPSGNLAHVEDLEEIHDAMMDLAHASPKAKKEAAAIHSLVSEGKLDASDVDSLVSHGVDKEAVAYYKKFYGEVDGGSEFASELVKEHVKAAAEQDKTLYKVKIARAYELANDMVSAGLLSNDRQAVTAQVDEIMKFNDESFESMKRIVAKHSPSLTKSASRLPVVGMFDTAPAQAVEQEDLRSQLASAFSSNTRRMF